MLERLDKTKRNIGLAAVALLLLWGAWTVRSVLNPLILGYLFAYILRPSVKGLENRGLGRREAVNVIFTAFAAVMTVTVLGVAFQAQQATERLMAASRSGHDPFAVAEARIDEVLEGASDWLHDMFGEDELERIHGFVHDHLPKRERERISRVAMAIGSVLANFFRGRLLICFLKGGLITLGLMVAGVPHPFLLGMLSGFMALIPFAGPFLSFLLAYFVGLQRMEPLEAALWIAPIYVLAEAVEGYVLIPKILGDSLGLHPVVILLAVFVGGSALGLFGFLIAVPLAATLIILFREFVMPALEEFAEEDSHVDPDPAEPSA